MTTEDIKIIEMTEFGPLVETSDGSLTIRHAVHGQDFHSTEGARFEAWQLYVVASGLLGDLTGGSRSSRVLDVGMGLSYNACATIAAWIESGGLCELKITSLEIDPGLVTAIAGGNAPWCRGWAEAWLMGPKVLKQSSENTWSAELTHSNSGKKLSWSVIIGDASVANLLPVEGDYDYIWQDPFTPELNPGMWSAKWFEKVRLVSSNRVQLMTYSVSRIVKDELEKGGWSHERFRTPGRKRHWLRATKQ